MSSTCVEARWFRRENLWGKRTRREAFGNAQGAIGEKTGQESVTCSRSHCDYAADSGQECQESLSITWEIVSCLPGLVRVGHTKLTKVSLTESMLNTHVLLFVCLLMRFCLSILSKCELFIRSLLCTLFIYSTDIH